jgi:hypothetical protein
MVEVLLQILVLRMLLLLLVLPVLAKLLQLILLLLLRLHLIHYKYLQILLDFLLVVKNFQSYLFLQKLVHQDYYKLQNQILQARQFHFLVLLHRLMLILNQRKKQLHI